MGLKEKVLGTIFAVGLAASVNAETLHERLEDKLEDGLPREEFYQGQSIAMGKEGGVALNRMYLVNGLPLIAQYSAHDMMQDERTMYFVLPDGACVYIYDTQYWVDPMHDGINGNEELYQETQAEIPKNTL